VDKVGEGTDGVMMRLYEMEFSIFNNSLSESLAA
jgi:hypothetical protein